jgi:hypothetical protein
MRALALLSSVALLAGCFPNNAKHRTIAKITEGGLIAGGIVILGVANTGADCDEPSRPGEQADCKSDAGFIGGVGLAMILVGMVGFIATVSTTPDDPPAPPPGAN